ncbi:MAG TPA: GntR family transcriptional regulator [Acidisoma sp.]|uniref:GntR family transcriptional regulator n=1 Tax=Acidisoma sp. TaxID=1872115 RepID=UPI002C1A22C8|nr:GntR family transcriptional regulator [Acidisoma sp.]HTI01681.1 GntR family transcriptional regulator [Acidisoma sp.]
MAAKYQKVAELLTRGIQTGAFQPGERLPGEIDLARSFEVSRSTIRQALSSLQNAGLIETWTGAGSFVCYNGARIDDGLGWSRALANHGVAVAARILRFERLEDRELAAALDLDHAQFLALDRVRSTNEGKPVSLERSRLPWRKAFGAVLESGLVDNSLNRTLENLGLKPMGGSEAVALLRLGEAEAEALAQSVGEPFLSTTRIVHDRDGAILEHVKSLLHPGHFTLSLSFGDAAR